MSVKKNKRVMTSHFGDAFTGTIKMGKPSKRIIVIESPPFAAEFIQVTCLMTDADLALAKSERPDLIFKTSNDLPAVVENMVHDSVEQNGLSIHGMTLPANVDIEWLE